MKAPFWIYVATVVVVAVALLLRLVVQPYVSGRVLRSRAERLWNRLQADPTAKLSVEVDELKQWVELIRRNPREAVAGFLEAPPAPYQSGAEPYRQQLMAAMDEHVTDTSRPSVRIRACLRLHAVGYQQSAPRHLSLTHYRREHQHA